jgi:cell division protein FtsL
MKASKQQFDQTEFTQQAPVFGSESESWWEEAKSRIKPEKKFIQTPKGKIILFSGLAFLLIIILLVIILWIKQTVQKGDLPQINDQKVAEQDLSPLQQQIIDLRQQLKAADPAKKDTPFPQVDLEMRID